MTYEAVLGLAIDAARQAGQVLREEFGRRGGPRGSGDHADVDGEVEVLLREFLCRVFPTFGFLGEETGDRPASAGDRHVWVVDPNDGTSSFLKGRRGPSVSIALLHGGEPVLGVVYAYAAPDHGGDLLAWAEGQPFTRNGREVQRRPWLDRLAPSAVVAVSPGAESAPCENAGLVAPARFLAMPSLAYRLALAAAGDVDACVSVNGPVSWDYAAGHALLRGAGGDLFDLSGQPVRYSTDGRGGVSGCIGGGQGVCHQLAGRPWLGVRFRRVAPEPLDLAGPMPGSCEPDAGLLSRAQGCLLGQIAGDALGSLVEFCRPEMIAARYPDGPRSIEDGGTWGTLAGQPTDDSELALMLARTLLRDGAWNADALAASYRYWLDSHPFDIGTTTRQALVAIRPGAGAANAARAAASRDSQANGSLMRISPLALFAHGMPDVDLGDLARADSALTHPHPICQDACAIYVVAIARALSGGGPGDVHEHALAYARRVGAQSALVDALEEARSCPPKDFLSHQGWVCVAFQNAFYRLVHAETFEDGVVETVRQGGDTDTNAAIAGALLGAVHGRDAVPPAWRFAVLTCRPLLALDLDHGGPEARHPRPRVFWPVDALVLAERLLLASRIGIGPEGQRCVGSSTTSPSK